MSDVDGRGRPRALVLQSVPQSVAQVRRFAVSACQEMGFGDACDVVALLVSEVATNALVHGDGDVRVSAGRSGGRLRVEVSDGGAGVPVMRGAGPEDEGGRGMALVDALSAEWGVRTDPASGKTVWFEVTGQ